MKKMKRAVCALVSVAVMASSVTSLGLSASAQAKTMDLVIDGNKIITAENSRYRGLGMVSGNNTSRLLLDYKDENPEAYWEIMNYTFGADGMGISHLKIEMGADINSSSGTEPATMRTSDEEADVTRGAGFQIAADAKSINPDLTLDMLWWSEPLWVSDSFDIYADRYKWYKGNLDAAYETYGIKFDYVSATRNERESDNDWIKYLAKALDNETDCGYDYSEIKIVAGEGVGSWSVANDMLGDEELLNAIDVIGSHYTDWSTSAVRTLATEYGKEVWLTENCPPMSYSEGTYKYDTTGSGLSDINGMLDIANRILTMFPGGMMTLYEIQPAIAAYYDGATYTQKQMITANTPWSGYYELDNGFYMALHFSQFIEKGWAYVEDACGGDGKAGGDGHAVVDAVYTYNTAADTETGDYTTVITNTTDETIVYNFKVSNLAKAGSSVDVWETRGPDDGSFDENYFKKIQTITPVENNGEYTYSVTIKPNSLVTVSTVEAEEKEYTNSDEIENSILPLPYSDDFEYADYDADYLFSRGGAPRYTTDEGGAFEVVETDGNNVLMQKITPKLKANEWGGTPNPVTNFGDDRWYNYSISADVTFEASTKASANYTGIGLRYNLADAGQSGYWLKLYENGKWELCKNRSTLVSGKIKSFDSTVATTLKISADGNKICAYANTELLAEYTDGENSSVLSAGRAALYSSYNANCFDNVEILPIGEQYFVTRFDDTDDEIVYSGDWTHTTMSTFKNYERTISAGTEGATAEISFSGTGLSVIGLTSSGAVISVTIDGKIVEDAYTVPACGNRETSYRVDGLTDEAHVVLITVTSGTYSIDAAEYFPSADSGNTSDDDDDTSDDDDDTSDDDDDTSDDDDDTSDDDDDTSDDDDDNNKDNPDTDATGLFVPAIAGIVAATAAVIIGKKRKA